VQIGFDVANTPFIPVSGLRGDNLTTKSESMDWYTGPTLIKALDNVKSPKRPIHLPLRLPIQDVYKIGGIGTVAVGRVETGTIKPEMNVTIAPTNLTTTVESVEMYHKSLSEAVPGDTVGFSMKRVPVKDISRGHVCSDSLNKPARGVER